MNTRPTFASTVSARTSVLRRFGVASMLLGLSMAPPAAAQDAVAPAASGAAAPQAPATDLRAVFIDLSGKVQWRAGEKEPWRDASVNDEVAPGVEVRTGLRSHAALRMRNATVLLDAGTVFQLPSSVQDGDVLRTTAAIKHGRADFKVDKVGLSNDFKVVTPSTTLAVRGTEFAIATGALKQVEVVGARRNAINAIELKYALNNTTVQLSGNSTSSTTVNHPAHQSAVAASPPLASAAAPPATSQAETVRTASAGESPASAGSPAAVQQGNRSTARAEKASGNSGGGQTGVVSRIQEQISEANARADQAIAILRGNDASAASVEVQRAAILALHDLAVARRQAAIEALADHEGALVDAIGERARYMNIERPAFLAAASAIDGPNGLFKGFDDGAAAARSLIEQIGGNRGPGGDDGPGDGVVVTGPGSGGGPQLLGDVDVGGLITQLRETIEGMAEDLELADGAWVELGGQRMTMDDLIARVGADAGAGEPGSRAAAAIEAYEAAVEDLRAALASGASARSAVGEALAAVRSASALVVALRDASPTNELSALAQAALGRLGRASQVLEEASGKLAAIESSLAVALAQDDETSEAYQRRERLRQVVAIHTELVGYQVAIVARLNGIEIGLVARSEELADIHEQAGDDIESVAQARALLLDGLRRLADAEGLVDPATGAPGAAGVALAEHAAALAEVETAESNAIAIRDGRDGFNETALRIDGADGHFDEFDADAASAGTLISQLAGAFGGESPGQGESVSGATDISRLLQDFQEAFRGMGDSLADATGGRDHLQGDLTAVDALVDSLDPDLLTRAADAIEEYQASMDRLAELVEAGVGTHEIVAEAQNAVSLLDTLIRRVAGDRPDRPELVAAAQASRENLRLATEALTAATTARDAIKQAHLAAGQDVRAGAFGDVADAFARLGSLAASVRERFESIDEGVSDRGLEYVALAASGGAVLSAQVGRLVTPFESADQGYRQLSTMASASTAYLAALDGAETAAGDAERSRGSALIERDIAVQSEANARFGSEATVALAAEGDLASAAGFRNDTRVEANAARDAADRAIGHADDARDARDAAIGFAADAARLRPDVEQFGTNREQFIAAAGLRNDIVAETLPLLAALQGDIQRYDEVVGDLALRTDSELVDTYASVSALARARAENLRSALEVLGASTSAAAAMAETASTNAGRLFGRSVTGYLERATLAYSNPNPDFGRGQQYGAAEFAQQADEAAIRAAAHLAAANAAISAANNGSGQGAQR